MKALVVPFCIKLCKTNEVEEEYCVLDHNVIDQTFARTKTNSDFSCCMQMEIVRFFLD